MTHASQRLFGTDGIRGKFGRFPITGEFFEKIGRALSVYLEQKAANGKIFIGADTRASANLLKGAILRGIGTSFTVHDLGVLATPAIAFLTKQCGAICGISITASHNPYADNGIKIFNGKGHKLPKGEEMILEDIIFCQTDNCLHPTSELSFRFGDPGEFSAIYRRHWKETFIPNCLAGLSIVFDAANGATAAYGGTFFSKLGARVFAIGDTPTGININENCGTEHPQTLQRTVVEMGANLGIALDGDGDRVVICDRDGKIFTGEYLLAFLAINFHQQNRLKSNCLVTTIACNTAVDEMLKKHGIRVHRCDIGDRNVAEAMECTGSNLGGEPSGHVICADFSPAADGLFTSAAFILAISENWDFRIASIGDYFRLNPCEMLNLPVSSKIPLEELPELQNAISHVENEFAKLGTGRVLVRYSGTENMLRILVEADTCDKVRISIQHITTALRAIKLICPANIF
ncbi:MAG: hypothetical protein LBD72_00150 [Puniceicoccales bacterium]|jgi:phosphoglucosamine mutase|nr:hypothetical protein [Puniceicoccales bacterium]